MAAVSRLNQATWKDSNETVRSTNESAFNSTATVAALPTVATARAPDNNQDLLVEWLHVQGKWQRADRPEWWRRLDREQLDVFIDAEIDVSVANKRRWTPPHSPAFLLRNNANMSQADKEQSMALLQGVTVTKDLTEK